MGDDSLRAAQSPTLPEACETYYTLQEAAAELGIDVAELRFAVKASRLTCSHHYGRHMVSHGDLENYRRRTQPMPAPSSPVTAAEDE